MSLSLLSQFKISLHLPGYCTHGSSYESSTEEESQRRTQEEVVYESTRIATERKCFAKFISQRRNKSHSSNCYLTHTETLIIETSTKVLGEPEKTFEKEKEAQALVGREYTEEGNTGADDPANETQQKAEEEVKAQGSH